MKFKLIREAFKQQCLLSVFGIERCHYHTSLKNQFCEMYEVDDLQSQVLLKLLQGGS